VYSVCEIVYSVCEIVYSVCEIVYSVCEIVYSVCEIKVDLVFKPAFTKMARTTKFFHHPVCLLSQNRQRYGLCYHFS